MSRSPKEWLGSLAFWTCYEVLQEGDVKHADTDWAGVSDAENCEHLRDHIVSFLEGVVRTEGAKGTPEEEEHLRHSVCRATMMYWSWLRDNGKLDKRLQLDGAFKNPETGNVEVMKPLRNPHDICIRCGRMHEIGVPHYKP